MIRDSREPIGKLLTEIDVPLLLAKHEGCLMFTDAGFEDVRAEFPDAQTVAVDKAPSADEGFAQALRVLRPVAQRDTKRAMSHEHVDVVRGGFDAWNRGDIDEWLAFFAAEAGWHMSPATPPTPAARRLGGLPPDSR